MDKLWVTMLCVCAVLCALGAPAMGGVQTLAVPVPGVGGFGVDIEIEGRVYRAELRRHSVRAEGFRVIEVLADGRVRKGQPDAVGTYRGEIEGAPGSSVAAWVSAEGVRAAIDLGDGSERVWVEPNGVEGAHRVERESARASAWAMCHGGVRGRDSGARDIGAGGGCGGEMCIAEIACDTDNEFAAAWGGNTVARIEAVINTINTQFERDAGIRHEISTIVVRSGAGDPYSATDAGAVLTELSTEWEDKQGGVDRDVAVLFSGKDFDGTIVGQAFLSSVCGLGYAVVQDRAQFSRMTDLTAHELGHCWGANHCACAGDESSGYTMNAEITGANRFHPVESVPQILGYRDGAACLDGLESGTATLPFMDDFEGVAVPALDAVLWTGVDGALSSTLGENEPSGTRSMRVPGDAHVRSARLDLSAQQDMVLSYDLQRGGGGSAPGVLDELIVEYRDDTGCWVELSRHAGTGASESVFSAHSHELPNAGAQHDGVRIRFRGGSVGGGDWFIDSVVVSGSPALPGSASLLLPSDGAVNVRTDTRLDWNATAHTETYRLRVDDSPSLATPLIDVELTTPRYEPPGGLPAGVVLYWRVESMSAAGSTGSSPAVASFTTFGTVPSSFDLIGPTGGTTVNSVTPTLRWDASAGATAYRVKIDRFFDFFMPIVDVVVDAPQGEAKLAYEVPGGILDDGSFYYWRVEAENLMGSRTGVPFAASFTVDTSAPCEGDTNMDGVVDVNDISAVLFALGSKGGDADANGDGVVDVNDLAYVLFRLGAC